MTEESDNSDCVIIENDQENNINYKSISCKNIPELFLDKLIARKHFSRFGRINKFILRPKRLACTVDYELVEEAKNAFMNSGLFNGQQFDVKFTETEPSHIRNTEEWVDSEVQAELEAMGSLPTNKNYQHHHQQQQRESFGMNSSSIIRNNPLKLDSPKFPKPILKTNKQQSSSSSSTTTTEHIINQQSVPKIDHTLKNELENVMRKPAVTAEDQYKILDARDKLIRMTTIRTTDIKKVVSIQGKCPDMCPEKERLLREARNQVATFELDNDKNQMNDKLAIKEYSRSSADQETPLAHELRPESVLKMTMNYLMNRIMGLCDDEFTNLADWFHFVWDRTRGIRKDITQQELCSLGAVELLEQCARFHIHCAARLIAEDPSVFDKRINTENLTKCLQTLKYMYHDLRLKNIKCPNESEFRGYIILLNLNDSNFLWEVKQLPDEIKNSKEIHSAIGFYLAMEGNNYVKFFRLIRQTTYMNACILLRYFSQVRYKALQTIVKAYNWPRQQVSLTLNYLKEILAFESEEEVISFVNHYGLDCDTEKVILDKNSLYLPDEAFFMKRALEVVETKRTVSVGESICGHPLESNSIFEKHMPHYSFDENGYLIPEAWTAEYRNQQGQQQQKPRTPTRNVDNIFKVPNASPPISPKQQLMKGTIFGQSIASSTSSSSQGTTSTFSLQSTSASTSSSSSPLFKTTPSVSGGTSSSSIFNIKPSPFTSIDTFDSIFQKPKTDSVPIFGQEKSSNQTTFNTTKSIFGNINFENQVVHKPSSSTNNIFAANPTKTQSLLPPSDNIFKLHDNVFQHFTNEPLKFTSLNTDSKVFNKPDTIFANQLSICRPPQQQKQQNLITLEENIEKEKQRLAAAQLKKQKERDEQIKLEEQLKQQKLEYEKLKKIEEAKRESELDLLRFVEEKRENMLLKSKDILNELCDEIKYEILYEIATSELDKYLKFIKNSEKLTNTLLNETIRNTISEICIEESAIFERNQKIIEKYFTIWKWGADKKRQRRKLIQETPIWIADKTMEQLANQVAHSAQNESLELMKRYRLGVPKNFELFMPSNNNKTKLNIFTIVENELGTIELKQNDEASSSSSSSGLLKLKKYFKFILSLPCDYEEIPGFHSYYSKFMENTIEQKQTTQLNNNNGFLCECRNQISICLRKISGILPTNEQNEKVRTECDHANGLIFLMTTVKQLIPARKRLHHLLKLSQINRKIPVALIVYRSSDEVDLRESIIEYALHIDELIDDEKILKFKLIQTNENHLKNSLEIALRFLARNIDVDKNNETFDLEMQKTTSFLQLTLSDGIWQRFHSSWLRNPSFRQFCLIPQNIINLYNEAVNRLINLVNEDYQDLPEFPNELKQFVPKSTLDIPQDIEYFPIDWKNYFKRNLKLSNFLKKIKLKNIEKAFSNEIELLEQDIINYSKLCIPNSEQSYRLAGYSSIKILLETINQPELSDLSISDKIEHISWLDIIRPICLEVLTYNWKVEQKNVPEEIIYRKTVFNDFNTMAWWLDDERLKEIQIQSNDNDCIAQSATQLLNEEQDDLNNTNHSDCSIDLEPILAKGFELVERTEENINRFNYYVETSREITKDLDISFYEYEYKRKFQKKYHPREDDLQQSVGSSIKQPCIKKSKMINEKNINVDDDFNDVIKKAFAVIEKVEKRMDIRMKCDKKYP